MKQIILFFSLFAATGLYAQKATVDYTAIDKKTLQIPAAQATTTRDIAEYIKANFTTDAEKARAIFIWTASNIQYDIDNMFAINFYEKTEDKIDKALTTKKGICANYAAVFHDICIKAGLKSYVIEGYTKQNGFTDYIPHAWCAALVDTSWFLFDPTWGSGYVSNHQFVKKINNAYFKATPAAMIKSHMPFDPMWEFLYYPLTAKEYLQGKPELNKTKQLFSYRDSMAVYNKQTEIERLYAISRRIEQNGISNAMIFDRLQHLKREIEIYNQNEKVNAHNFGVNTYNEAVASYNEAVNDFNAFIQYRNSQFSPKKTDAEIQNMIDIPDNKIKAATEKLKSIAHPDGNTAALIISLQKSVDDIRTHVDEQKEWLSRYLAKGAFGRKSMFTKYTWMGIPLN